MSVCWWLPVKCCYGDQRQSLAQAITSLSLLPYALTRGMKIAFRISYLRRHVRRRFEGLAFANLFTKGQFSMCLGLLLSGGQVEKRNAWREWPSDSRHTCVRFCSRSLLSRRQKCSHDRILTHGVFAGCQDAHTTLTLPSEKARSANRCWSQDLKPS